MLLATAPCRPELSKIPQLRYGGACGRQQPSGDVLAGSDHLLLEFEAPSLSEAVALASELRSMGHGRVQIRPEFPRLLDRRWRVVMTIPSMRGAAAQILAEARELASRHVGCRLVDTEGGPVCVLIVDDSPPFRRAARELLQRRGYVVVGEVGTAAAALNAVGRISPDALLVDVGLPDGCGFELTRVLVRAQPDLAVLLMSANDPPAAKERVRASGARGFVLKSYLAGAPLERFWRTPSP
jgi:CheY-like chemotaxis protein